MSTLFLSFLFFIQPGEFFTPRLSVEITNVRKAGGTMRVGVYRPGAKFGVTEPVFYKHLPVRQTGRVAFEIELEPGTYALALYHDQNNNDKIDKNLIGYPTEPFGFSNNYRPRFSAPAFTDCDFVVPAQGTSVSIKLID